MVDWFGASWTTVGGVVTTTVAFYLTLLLAVRLAGRRTLAQMSAFDIVVTVALGSLLATTVVSPTPTYGHAVAALLTLLMLQVGLAAVRQRSAKLRHLLDFEPVVVVRDGAIDLSTTPLGPQITPDELMGKLRQQGVVSLDDVALVVVEPNGQISVLRCSDQLSDGDATLMPGTSAPYRRDV